ncbi:MAG TPA: VWA domain-containing protein [Solirubrobacter sp.]|nr:VWA domain-containing protein [Solirubrobacter sp.]
MRALIAVVAALAWLPASAFAQAPDTRNRALIVLDASKSMNEDAGNGGTRLDAAKQAVAELVDRLPRGAPIGLRVYGAKVAETSREEACRDTELTIPVGPLDKEELTGAVNGLTGKGRTPIGNSLLATPDDLGSTEGRRTVILVSDGGDNCAPPNPCEAAREVARQGLELTISVVGLQVNERVRRQLECIARAGGGSYSDVQDAGKLGDELAALLVRAYRSYEPSGTKVEGAPERGGGPNLSAGLFQDSLTVGDQRWYTLEVPEGRRVLASVTAIPPYDASGGSTFRTELLDPEGGEVAVDQGLLNGGLSATEAGRVETQSLRTPGPVDGGRYMLGVSVDSGNLDDVPIALEIGIQFLEPGEEVGLTREAGELATPTPTPTATEAPRESGAEADESTSLGWPAVGGIGVLGVLVGLTAVTVLGRRAGR